MRRSLILVVTVCAAIAGCGQMASVDYRAAEKAKMDQIAAADPAAVVGQATSSDADAKAKPLARKIIYTARLFLLVDEFASIPSEVATIARRFDGYVARSDQSGAAGRSRHGTWTLRVPVDHYEPCLAALRDLGQVERESADSKDVSEEFYDLGTRIRNKRRQEDRLVKLLDEATGELEQVLAVEKELARVRGEIEQMEGRLRVLSDLTAMTTIELSVRSLATNESPQKPSFSTRARRTFDASYDRLVAVGEGLLIGAVGLSVWVPAVLIPSLVVWAVVRRRRRRRLARIPIAQQVEP